MSFMWKPKTSSSRSTSAAGAPLSSVLGGFADGQVASIQFNGGCCPGGIKGQRHWRVLLLFVQLVIYSCASHKVNHPLFHTVTLLFPPIREQSEAGVFIFNQLLYNQKNQIGPSRKYQLLTPWFIWHLHVSLCGTIKTWKKKSMTPCWRDTYSTSAYLSCCCALLLFTAHLLESFCFFPHRPQ